MGAWIAEWSSHSTLNIGMLRPGPWVRASVTSNSFSVPSTTSMLYSWFYLICLIRYYYLSVKFVMWIVKQKIENKRNLFKKKIYIYSVNNANTKINTFIGMIPSCGRLVNWTETNWTWFYFFWIWPTFTSEWLDIDNLLEDFFFFFLIISESTFLYLYQISYLSLLFSSSILLHHFRYRDRHCQLKGPRTSYSFIHILLEHTIWTLFIS